jgi:two-component system, chemotaxis family, chemotaxis protein CheY
VRILIVDDEAVIRRLLGSMLVRASFEVVAAEDGDAAWQVLQEQPIDLVITDYSMSGLNGLDLLRRIRATPAYASLPVIMLTGTRHDQTTADEAEREGANAFMTKHLSPATLLPAIERALGSRAR